MAAPPLAAAFHRARGHHAALDFARFRERVLLETLPALPPLLQRRLFVAWRGPAGSVELAHFLAAAELVTSGSREQLLAFVFRLMRAEGGGSDARELSERDTREFLEALVAGSRNGVVAVETVADGSTRAWRVREFIELLHPKTAAGAPQTLTCARFLETLRARQFSKLSLIDWIPALAMMFRAAMTGASLNSSPPHSLRTIDEIAAAQPKRCDDERGRSEGELIVNVAEPLTLSPEVLQVIRSECFSILDFLVSTGEKFATDTFEQRFCGVVSPAILFTVREVDKMNILAPVTMSSVTTSQRSGPATSGRARFRSLMFTLLSTFAASADDTARLLFAIFDEHSKGALDVLQFAAFLRFASEMSYAESERVAFSTIALLSADGNTSPRTSEGAQDKQASPSVTFGTFCRFFQGADLAQISLPSLAAIEMLHLIFHLEHTAQRHNGNEKAMSILARNSLKNFTKQLRLARERADAKVARHTQSICIMERRRWNAIIEIVCGGDAATDSGREFDDTHEALVSNVDVSVAHAASMVRTPGLDPTTKPAVKDDVVLVPLDLWVVLAFWSHKIMSLKKAGKLSSPKSLKISDSDWREWTKTALFLSSGGSALVFEGVSVAVAVAWSPDSEGVTESTVLDIVASVNCSIRDIVDALHLQQTKRSAALYNRTHSTLREQHPARATIRDCQLRFGDQATLKNAVAAAHSLRIPEDFHAIPLKRLMATIASQEIMTGETIALRHLELHVSADELAENTKEEARIALEPTSFSNHPNHARQPAQRSAPTDASSIHGLANLGNTCFMNSALQCLAATPLLREYFLRREFLFDMGSHYPELNDDQVLSATSTRTSTSNNVLGKHGKTTTSLEERRLPPSTLLPLAFGELVAEMDAFSSTGKVSGVCDVISPERMQRAITLLFPHLSDGSQQDAQEFLSSLLTGLGEELSRRPVNNPLGLLQASTDRHTLDSIATSDSASDSILSPQSRTFLSHLPSFSRQRQYNLENDNTNHAKHDPQTLRFQVSDSDGRPDATVANEWWISHLISEPSIITALFSGQFKSVLSCSICGARSSRFEPFSSLQLPIVEGNTNGGTGGSCNEFSRLIVIATVHRARSVDFPFLALRVAMEVEKDWTVEQLLSKLKQDHEVYSLERDREYFVCTIDGCRIQRIIDMDAPLAAMPPAIDVFELEDVNVVKVGDGDSLFDQQNRQSFTVGDELLVWTPTDRYVKGQVTCVHSSSSRSKDARNHSSPQSQPRSTPTSYDVVLQEGLSAGDSMRAVSCVQPMSASSRRILFFRFLHRRVALVPFYCASPTRLILCGSPSVHRALESQITGRFLYQVARERFLLQLSQRTFVKNEVAANALVFVIRRVRADGSACGRCHWSSGCTGCVVPRTDDVVQNLEMDETFAIDWDLESLSKGGGYENTIEWLATQGMASIVDHESYTAHRQSSSFSLEQSFRVLCSTEKLEVSCSRCERIQSEQRQQKQQLDKQHSTNGESAIPTTRSVSLFTKELSLWSLPPVLVIQLKRFEFNQDSMSWTKVDYAVDFPIHDLNLEPFLATEASHHLNNHNCCSKTHSTAEEYVKRAATCLHSDLNFPLDTASRDVTHYRLYGIVNHTGGIGSGHYTAHVKRSTGGTIDDEWWLADDATGVPVSSQRLSPSPTAYLLFYVRHDLISAATDEDVAATTSCTVRGGYGRRDQEEERQRLSSFFPRQKAAVKLSDTLIQAAWKHKGVLDLSAPIMPESGSKGRSSDACGFM